MPSSKVTSAHAGHRIGLALLLMFGMVLHLSQIDACFGFGEGNAGSYFGCVAKGYREVGFAATRGAPFMPDIYGGLIPYMHHPPGGFWLTAVLGPREWQLRTTTLVAHLTALLALVALVRPILGSARALLAGALFLVLPAYYVDISASQWPFTIACGLVMLLAFSRLHAGEGSAKGWRATMLAAAFVGPWIDWHFGFFCLALIPLALPWRGFVRRLLGPATFACTSLVLYLLWRQWAAQAPIWNVASVGIENTDLIAGTILRRPAVADQAAGMLRCSALALTWPILAAGVVGWPWLFARAARTAGALLVFGLLGSLLFGIHAQTHTDFPSMLGPAVVIGTASLLGRGRAGLLAGAIVFVVAGVLSLQRVQSARTTFFRDYGQAATAATRETRADGSVRRYILASETWWIYRYYIDSPDVLILPVSDPDVVEQNRAAIAKSMDKGVRFLSLRYGGPVGSHWAKFPALEEYLAKFPAVRLPVLEQSFAVHGVPDALRIERALLVTIEP